MKQKKTPLLIQVIPSFHSLEFDPSGIKEEITTTVSIVIIVIFYKLNSIHYFRRPVRDGVKIRRQFRLDEIKL